MRSQAEFDAIAGAFGVGNPFEAGMKLGIGRCELLMRMALHNHAIFEDWVRDYARRLGRDVNEVRAEVMEQRRRTYEHCNAVYRRQEGIRDHEPFRYVPTDAEVEWHRLKWLREHPDGPSDDDSDDGPVDGQLCFEIWAA